MFHNATPHEREMLARVEDVRDSKKSRKVRQERRERIRTVAACLQVCITLLILTLTIYGLVSR